MKFLCQKLAVTVVTQQSFHRHMSITLTRSSATFYFHQSTIFKPRKTGIMWELAPKLGARIVFAEHRYEGKSLPTLDKDCLSYASTMQALADYARLLEEKLNPHNTAPVITFGGSYGGMLSAWMVSKVSKTLSSHGCVVSLINSLFLCFLLRE